MSEVFLEFSSDYISQEERIIKKQILARFAVFAWNLSFVQKAERDAKIKSFLKKLTFLSFGGVGDHVKIKNDIYKLVKKKNDFFSEYDSQIANAELEEKGDRLIVTVTIGKKHNPKK